MQQGIIQTAHVRTKEQPGDLFTKPVGSTQFQKLLGKLNVINIHSNLRESIEDND